MIWSPYHTKFNIIAGVIGTPQRPAFSGSRKPQTNLDFLQKVKLERAVSTITNLFKLLQFLKIRLIIHFKKHLIGEKNNVFYQAPVAQFNWKQEHMCDLLNLSSFSAAAEQEHLIKKVDQNLLCTNI